MSDTRRLLLEFETEQVGIRAQKNKKVRKALVSAFSDASDVVRERALLASIDLGDPSIVVELAKALDDEEEAVRIACAQALAFYHQPRTVPDLLKGLKDSNTWVRSHCAAGLSKLLRGPIWARLSTEDIEDLAGSFPDTDESGIRNRLSHINLSSDGIDRYLNWRSQSFDIEIDVTEFVRELEEAPIVLAGAEARLAAAPVAEEAPRKTPGLSAEVEEILSELPEDLRETLPSEDLRRLTPETARELVESLKVSPEVAKPKRKPKKKAVKVRKVKKVRRKKGAPTRQELIEKIPDEVRESVSDEVLKGLTYEELEALIASTMEAAPPVKEAKKPKRKRAAKAAKVVVSAEEKRLGEYSKRYGEDKAQVLMTVTEDMLVGIPEEQIQEMDLETLKALLQALEPD